jgi:hypothetical protein
MNALSTWPSLSGWASWTSLSAYAAAIFAAVLVIAVIALIAAQNTVDEHKPKHTDSHGVAF